MTCPVVHGAPGGTVVRGVPIYGEEHSRDPRAVYDRMRRAHGSLAPVELAPGVPATLVLGYRTAVKILNDPEHFPADPRAWEQTVAEDCPLLPMMRYQPAARYTTGPEHTRYRAASTAAINGVDLHALHEVVEHLSTPLVTGLLTKGRADLAADYAYPLTFAVLNETIGCPEGIGTRITAGMAARFDSTTTAGHGMNVLTDALHELVRFKRAHPGDDVTTRLIDHSTDLDEPEVVAQLMSFYGAGIEAQRNLIINTTLLMLTDERFGGSLISGSLSTRDALDEVLFDNAPMANFCITFPRQPILIDDTWLPAHQPLVIGIAACNSDPTNDPAIAAAMEGIDRTGNRSHLAFGAGPHACPARSMAYQIACDAIDHLLDLAPEMTLAVPVDALTWRPGPFHRSLTALPVTLPNPRRPARVHQPMNR